MRVRSATALFSLSIVFAALPLRAQEPDCAKKVWEDVYAEHGKVRESLAFHLAQQGCRPRALTAYQELISRVEDPVNKAGNQVELGETILGWCGEKCCQETYDLGLKELRTAKGHGGPHSGKANDLLAKLEAPALRAAVVDCTPELVGRPTSHYVLAISGLVVGVGIGLVSIPFFLDANEADAELDMLNNKSCGPNEIAQCDADFDRAKEERADNRLYGGLLVGAGSALLIGTAIGWIVTTPEPVTAFILPTRDGATMGLGFTF